MLSLLSLFIFLFRVHVATGFPPRDAVPSTERHFSLSARLCSNCASLFNGWQWYNEVGTGTSLCDYDYFKYSLSQSQSLAPRSPGLCSARSTLLTQSVSSSGDSARPASCITKYFQLLRSFSQWFQFYLFIFHEYVEFIVSKY